MFTTIRACFGILLCSCIGHAITAQCTFNYTGVSPFCPGTPITFTVANPDPMATYTWNFDNMPPNTDATGPTVTHSYPYSTTPTNYVVTLYKDGVACSPQQTVSVLGGPLQPTFVLASTTQTLVGNNINACNVGLLDTLIVANSTPTNGNVTYTIDWGDGSMVETFNNSNFGPNIPVSHPYSGYGYKIITVTSISTNGCKAVRIYTYFSGFAPANPGLSVNSSAQGLCAPDTLSFNLIPNIAFNYLNNPVGTIYQFYLNTTLIDSYSQSNVPNTYTCFFPESSCGKTTPSGLINAYALKVVATNPCGVSTETIVQPIRLSSKPSPNFSIQGPSNYCPGQEFTFTNTSTNINEVNSITGECKNQLSANWSISPGTLNVDWVFTSGTQYDVNEIKVKFLKSGNYTVKMTLVPQPACGPSMITKTITILEPPTANAIAQASNATGCSPLTVNFNNQSAGYMVSYNWNISPATGWSWLGGTNAMSKDPSVLFTTPGTYNVTLTASNVCATSTWTTQIVVRTTPSITLPMLGPFCQVAALNFTQGNTTYGNGNGNISGFSWMFPGGTPANSTQPYPTNIQYGPVTSSTAYTYTVTATNECGPTSASGTFQIQTPAAITLPPNLTLCLDAMPYQITYSPSGGNWSGSGVSNNGLFNPANAGGPGVKTLVYTYGAAGSPCTATASMTITVVDLPATYAGTDLSACIDAPPSTLMGSPGGATGVWTTSSMGLSGNSFNPGLAGAGAHTLTYTFTDANGCRKPDDLIFTVHPLPVIAVNDTTYCNTPGLVNLPYATPAGGAWTGSGVSGNQFNPQTPGGPNYMATYTYTNSNGCKNSKTINIAVTAPQAVNAGKDTLLCASVTAFDLSTGVTPMGGTWTSNGAGLSGSTFNPNAAGPGIYTLTYSFGNGNCKVIDTRIITVAPLPPTNAGADRAVCADAAPIMLTGSPAGPTGVWTSASMGLSGSTFNPAQAGAGTHTLTYSFTDGNGCFKPDDMVVTVNSLPVIKVQDTSYCNTPGLVALPYATPINGIWAGTGVSGNQFNPQTAGGPNFTATYSFTDGNGCKNSKTINIAIIDPAVVNAGKDTLLCVSVTAFDLSTGVVPLGGAWSSSGAGLSGNIFNPNQAGPGAYTFTYSIGAGNCKVTDTRIITVAPLPPTNAGADRAACIDAPAMTLNGSPPGSGGVWATASVGLSGNIFDPAQAGIGQHTLTYSFTDVNGCFKSDDLLITVFALPVITVQDTTYCNTPGLVALPFATPANGTWSGTGVSGNLFNPQTLGGPDFTATYTFTDGNSCKNSKTINIAIIDPAVVNAGKDTLLCVSVNAFDLTTGVAPNGGSWTSTGAGLSGNTFNPSQAGPGAYIFTYSIGTGNCQVTDTRTITVAPLPLTTAGADRAACVDQSPINLMGAPNGMGGVWSTSSIGLTGNTFDPTVAGTGQHTLTYGFTDANGCFQADDVVITVNPLPVLNVQDTTYCNTPGLVTLPYATPINGTWTGPGVTGNLFDPQTSGGPNFTTTYTYFDDNGCKNSKNITIAIIDPAVVYAGVDTAFCVSVTAFDLSTGISPAGGVFSSTGVGLNGNVFNPNAAGAGQHVVTYSVGTGNCLVKDTRTIQVHPLPAVEAGMDAKTCISESAITLSATPAGGAWTSSGSGSVSGIVFNPALSGVGTYSLTYGFTDINGCQNNDSLQMSVNPLPTPLSVDTTFCNTPGLVLLPVAAPPGGSWTGTGVTGLQFDPIGAGGVGSYPASYHFTDTQGCTDSTTVQIMVIDPVVPEAGADDTICINTGQLQLAGFSPASGGKWSGVGIVNAQTGVFNPAIAGGGTHTLVFSFGVGNCQLYDSLKVHVIAVAIEAGPDRAACLDDAPITLTGFAPNGGTWTGTGVSSGGIFNPATAGVGAHTLRYEYVDPVLGCIFQDSLGFQVNPMPQSNFPPPTTTCIGEEIQFKNLSQSTYSVHWSFGDGNISTLAEPVHTYQDTGTYSITLTTSTEFGCSDFMTRTIFVTKPPTAFFTPMPDSGCAVLTVLFDNKSYGYQTSYSWSFGGPAATQYNPGPIQLAGGTQDTTYTFVLTATNLCATRTWTDSVLVHPLPIVIFGTSLDTICSGETVLFANLSVGNPENFSWDFGNGLSSTDSLPAPMKFFTDSIFRTYTIRLISTNFCGADTAYHDVIVKPVDVRAFFNLPNTTGCQPYTVQFSNFGTPGASVAWDFGDGNTSAAPSPMHTFQQAGTFKVVQKVTAGCGYDSTFQYVTVLPAPQVSFSSAPQICRNDTLQFTNTSLSMLSGLHWNFGDSDTSVLNNPRHAFATAGVKTVTLTGISAENGCPASISKPVLVLELPSVAFSFSPPDGCMPLDVKFQNQSQGSTYYEWNFGDGNTKNGPAPSHTYQLAGQYAVELKAIDINGCRNDSTFRYITVHPIPSPAFVYQRDHLCGLPVLVSFTNQTPDAISYSWLFGDNTGTSVQNNPQHTYLLPGDYTVQLIAENTFGCRDTTESTFIAYARPVADFTPEPLEGCSPLRVVFENFSTDDTAAKWYFSDGGTSDSLAQTTHVFWQPGQYNATLVAIHRDVCFDTLTLSNAVNVKPSPAANFSFSEIVTDPASGMFQFTDLSMGAVRWHWDFGDGHSSDLQHPEHRYYSNQTKTVRLTVFAANDCPDDTTMTLTPHDIRGLFLPSAFTPSLGNGLAAVFKPAGAGLKAFEVEVYSSYGQLLWRSDKLVEGQPAEFWDGTYRGELQPEDVYTWQVRVAIFEDGTSWEGKRVGSLTLIR